MELLRVVAAVVPMPLLPLAIGLATCAAGRPRSVVDEIPAAVFARGMGLPSGFSERPRGQQGLLASTRVVVSSANQNPLNGI